MNTDKAWYLGCTRDQVGERVILIGDPGRVPRLSQYLEDVQLLPVNRGLVTATGRYHGVPVTMAAFGMGAPIAAIVLHELRQLGAGIFLRIGTAMPLPPVEIGDFVIAEGAIRHEGTSDAYASPEHLAIADETLVKAAVNAVEENGHSYRVGSFASYDGFYKDMFALDTETSTRVRTNFEKLSEQGVLAVDMETSALLTVGNVLGCKVSSLCVATVDGLKQLRMSSEELIRAEKDLIAIALAAVTATEMPEAKEPSG